MPLEKTNTFGEKAKKIYKIDKTEVGLAERC